MGRSAGHVLREYPNVVRVFICASKEYRMKKVAEMYGDSPEATRRSIPGPAPHGPLITKPSPGGFGVTSTAMSCALTQPWGRGQRV